MYTAIQNEPLIILCLLRIMLLESWSMKECSHLVIWSRYKKKWILTFAKKTVIKVHGSEHLVETENGSSSMTAF